MKSLQFKISAILVLAMLTCVSKAQTNLSTIDQLNSVLKYSLYKSSIELNEDGLVTRTDNNGNTFKYKLRDIESVSLMNDGLNNVLIKLKAGKVSSGIVEGKEVKSDMNVFAFHVKKECEEAIRLFKLLIVEELE